MTYPQGFFFQTHDYHSFLFVQFNLKISNTCQVKNKSDTQGPQQGPAR